MSFEDTAILQEEVDNFMQFAGAEKAKPNPVFIAILGATGSGKSSFIKAVAGRDDVTIGHDLLSCTGSVSIFHYEIEKYNVYLIDTPGFDDTNRSDLEILKTVSNFLSVSYANKNYLNGLIYLHSISDPRIGRTRKLNIEMFKALCGVDAFSNLAILTSMWSTDDSSIESIKQVARETQLKEDYLTDVIEGGGLLRRLKSDKSSTIDVFSAKEIFRELFSSWKDDKIVLRIQHELVNLLVPLNETAAGKVLSIHQDETLGLREAIEDVRVSGQELVLHQHDMAATIPEQNQQKDASQRYSEKIRADRRAMNVSLLEIHAEERARLTAQLLNLENRWRKEFASRQREQSLREQLLSEMRASALQRQATVAELRQQQQQAIIRNQEREAAQRHRLTLSVREQEIRREFEMRYHKQLLQQGKWREEDYKAELKRTREEVERMRENLEKRTETTAKAKRAWVDPVLQGVMSGGIGLVGTVITAGKLDSFDDVRRALGRELFTDSPAGALCIVQ